MKICSKCKKEKRISNFRKHKSYKDNVYCWCKECVNEYYHVNRERMNGRNKELYQENREKRLRQRREYCKKYPERVAKQKRREYLKNKERHLKRGRDYQKEKRKVDIHFKIKKNVSKLIWSRLKSRLSGKDGLSTFRDILPYTLEELMQHLESRFESWMNWDNYGAKRNYWVIDHIKPDSSFNYKSTNDKEFQECWALSNLQPLEFIENIKKGNKIKK